MTCEAKHEMDSVFKFSDVLWVRLTLSQMYPQPLHPCHPYALIDPYAPTPPYHPPTPQERHLMAKSDTTTGQLNIWSAFGSGWPLVRCPPSSRGI